MLNKSATKKPKDCDNCPWVSLETCKVCKQDKQPAKDYGVYYIQKISMN